jgi:hypothetical protein
MLSLLKGFRRAALQVYALPSVAQSSSAEEVDAPLAIKVAATDKVGIKASVVSTFPCRTIVLLLAYI